MYPLPTKFTLALLLLLSSPIPCFSHPPHGALSTRDTPLPLPLPVKLVHQFPKPTWVENLAVRSNAASHILCTILTAPELYLVDPDTGGSATLLHTFQSVDSLLGIAELGHDVFYVAAGNFSLQTLALTPGSWAVFEVDIRGYDEAGVAGVKVQELVNIKEAILLNGATRLDSASETLLVADSFVGGVWEVDVETGAYRLGIDIPEMKGTNAPGFSTGVNGIKVKDGYLYFSNTGQETLNRVAIDVISGAISGAVEVLASGIAVDDFVIGEGGLIWVAQGARNLISVLLKNGTVVDVAGTQNFLTVPGPTACQFGKGDKLYCSSTGGLASMVNGMFVGGELLEIDTADFDL